MGARSLIVVNLARAFMGVNGAIEIGMKDPDVSDQLQTSNQK